MYLNWKQTYVRIIGANGSLEFEPPFISRCADTTLLHLGIWASLQIPSNWHKLAGAGVSEDTSVTHPLYNEALKDPPQLLPEKCIVYNVSRRGFGQASGVLAVVKAERLCSNGSFFLSSLCFFLFFTQRARDGWCQNLGGQVYWGGGHWVQGWSCFKIWPISQGCF